MRASSSGPIGALLMIAPLVAIPVVAIVGIPQFAPVVASSGTESDFGEEPFVDRDDSTAVAFSTPRRTETAPRGADDLFAPLPGAADTSVPRKFSSTATEFKSRERAVSVSARDFNYSADFDRPPVAVQTVAWTPPSEALDGWDVDTAALDSKPSTRTPSTTAQPTGFRKDLLNSSQPATPVKPVHRSAPTVGKPATSPASVRNTSLPREAVVSPERSRQPNNQNSADEFSWDQATQKLRELGIRKHQLEWLAEANSFLFTCTFTPPHSPRVTHRFEAEADEPLHAVHKVLEQIDAWQTQR